MINLVEHIETIEEFKESFGEDYEERRNSEENPGVPKRDGTGPRQGTKECPKTETKAEKTPYGTVPYADPGYQKDGVKRYPIDTETHVRAAWSYINMPKNQENYTSKQIDMIKSRIKIAAKKFGIQIAEG